MAKLSYLLALLFLTGPLLAMGDNDSENPIPSQTTAKYDPNSWTEHSSKTVFAGWDIVLFQEMMGMLSINDWSNLSQTSRNHLAIVILYSDKKQSFEKLRHWKLAFDPKFIFVEQKNFELTNEMVGIIKGEEKQVKLIAQNIILDPNFRLPTFPEAYNIDNAGLNEMMGMAVSVYLKLFNDSYWKARKDLEDITKFYGYDQGLMSIYLQSKGLYLLPNNIGAITERVSNLHLDFNCLTVLPKEIGNLVPLFRISIKDNHSYYIPIGLSYIINLSHLDIQSKNPIELRPEILECSILNMILYNMLNKSETSSLIIETIKERQKDLQAKAIEKYFQGIFSGIMCDASEL